MEVINRNLQHYLNNPDIANLANRQNIYLCSITHKETLARLVAERLEVSLSKVSKDLSDITSKLERYRLQQFEPKEKQQTKQAKLLTETECTVASAFLKNKNLLAITNEMIEKNGIVCEELNRLIMYLIYARRKTAKTLHIISMGRSGKGKIHLQVKVR